MSGETILIAEDDVAIARVVSTALMRSGFKTRSTTSAAGLWEWIANGQGDAIITDVCLPDENSLDLLPRIKAIRPELPIIVMSANNTLLTAVRANESGAFDYLPKPFDIDLLIATVKRSISKKQTDDTVEIELAPSPQGAKIEIIGRSPPMQEIYRMIARLAPTDLSVLISGESGTGKELVARALHDYSHRSEAPFVAVNMAAIPRDLIESELFGHVKGAFTGAVSNRTGRFAQAEGGTLFLDEIGDMPIDAQTRLLRVLQQSEYVPVGAADPVKSNIRIIAASHRDLRQMIDLGHFREDLYYRLNVVPINLPPLRVRKDDIPSLATHFLHKVTQRGLKQKTMTPGAMQTLKGLHWRGNVRELENLIQRVAVLCVEDVIDAEAIGNVLERAYDNPSLHTEEQGSDFTPSLDEIVKKEIARFDQEKEGECLYKFIVSKVEKPLLQRVLDKTGGNQIKAASLLGVNRNTLRKKIKELDINLSKQLS